MWRFTAFTCGILLLFSSVTSTAQDDGLDVPFVPTRYDVVDAMLDVAAVGSDDILYDLGCGDGRIVIMAAEKFGTRGIGIDLNPDRIDESIMNAAAAGVNDHVTFIEQDLFDTDFREATVITMYLLPHVNVKLRPRLFKQLRPGTRIVSHDFDMGQWRPDDERVIHGENDNHYVYLWIIPANVTGTWKWQVHNELMDVDYTLDLVQEFQQVDGRLSIGAEKVLLTDITLTGDQLSFSLTQAIDGTEYVMAYSGTVDGGIIDGAIVAKAGTMMRNCQWTATCDPATMKEWDVDE